MDEYSPFLAEKTCYVCNSKSLNGDSCNKAVKSNLDPQDPYFHIDCNCPRCGVYKIMESAAEKLKGFPEEQKINISGWIRDHQGSIIDDSNIGVLLTIKMPSLIERAEKLLLEISKNRPNVEQTFYFPKDLIQETALGSGWYKDEEKTGDYLKWLGVTCSKSCKEVLYLANKVLMEEHKWLEPNGGSGYRITPAGHLHIDSLNKQIIDSNIGFCAMWFDERVKPVWTEAISPAIHDCGYTPKRIDEHPHNDKIDDEIMAMIQKSKFIVADFTGQRGGVYFETGYAIGLGVPVIWTCREDELDQIHFDNRQYNFLRWDDDKMDDFKRRLKYRIENTVGRGNK